MALVQQSHYAVSLSVGGQPVSDVFDSFEGGDVRGESSTYRAGGMAEAEAITSPPVTEEITLSRGYRAERDAAIERWLTARIGHECVVGKQILGADRQPVQGGLTTYRGLLTGVTTTTHDSMGSDVNRFSVTIMPRGLPT